MTRRRWTEVELDVVRERYPHEHTRDVAIALDRTRLAVYQMAAKLGLAKSDEYRQRLHQEEGGGLRGSGPRAGSGAARRRGMRA